MMTKQNVFQELQPFDDVYKFIKGNLRSIAFRLADGNLCLVNPLLGTSEDAWNSLECFGDIAFIVSPNHYHNKGLRDASLRFPQAQICSSQEAIPRLEKITDLKLSDMEGLRTLLPKEITIEYTEGLKTGEVWFRLSQSDTRALIVADAFCGVKMSKNQESAGDPQLLKTFPTYGVKDVKQYKLWASNSINSYAPNMLVPFHGGTCQDNHLTDKLTDILSAIG